MTTRPIALAFALLLTATACGGSDDDTADPGSNPSESSSGAVIRIKSFAYNDLTVAPGTTITIKNFDDAEHTVTSEQKGLFDVDDIKQGEDKTLTAPTTPGTYRYICTYHSSMKGSLTVS